MFEMTNSYPRVEGGRQFGGWVWGSGKRPGQEIEIW